MGKKVVPLDEARRRKRRQGWTLDEIKKRAAQEYRLNGGLTQNEPKTLVSGGDMKKILEEKGDDEQQ